ncbi:hypothetical protein HOLleu_13592 [Holothuria leucospilota]|uniref:Uncharacterized protein n=1 Tax=Holothuria leucospilota TaxID=206669 RepID=A0A9Q1CC00_HOLLE|nr:hypothetical protein HOLleu_13592 [Holothuria leucospilota]
MAAPMANFSPDREKSRFPGMGGFPELLELDVACVVFYSGGRIVRVKSKETKCRTRYTVVRKQTK